MIYFQSDTLTLIYPCVKKSKHDATAVAVGGASASGAPPPAQAAAEPISAAPEPGDAPPSHARQHKRHKRGKKLHSHPSSSGAADVAVAPAVARKEHHMPPPPGIASTS